MSYQQGSFQFYAKVRGAYFTSLSKKNPRTWRCVMLAYWAYCNKRNKSNEPIRTWTNSPFHSLLFSFALQCIWTWTWGSFGQKVQNYSKLPHIHVKKHCNANDKSKLWRGQLHATVAQPRSHGLLLVQNGGRRNPWPRLLKYSKNRRVFCHVTHDEMAFSEVVSRVWQPCLFSAIGNRYSNKTKTFHRVCEILTNFWSHFGSLGQRLLRPPF